MVEKTQRQAGAVVSPALPAALYGAQPLTAMDFGWQVDYVRERGVQQREVVQRGMVGAVGHHFESNRQQLVQTLQGDVLSAVAVNPSVRRAVHTSTWITRGAVQEYDGKLEARRLAETLRTTVFSTVPTPSSSRPARARGPPQYVSAFAKFGAFGQLVSLGEPSPLSPTPRPIAHATPPPAAGRGCRCIRADYREPGAAAQGVATIMLCLHRLVVFARPSSHRIHHNTRYGNTNWYNRNTNWYNTV
jgi:hypothetical protein